MRAGLLGLVAHGRKGRNTAAAAAAAALFFFPPHSFHPI